MILLLLILIIPLILSSLSLLPIKTKYLAGITSAGYLLPPILGLRLSYQYLETQAPITGFNLFYADALSLFFVLTISVVTLAVALYSHSFILGELDSKLISLRQSRFYYRLFNLFVFSIYLVTVVGNLGLMWVAIEITTLISAFLVGFHNTKEAIEAAWKYIIICSVGIILALLGTIFFTYAFLFSAGLKSLNWPDLIIMASQLDPNMVKAAFIFILIGYGTKAGLAPMHTWLPDAHSQAISPISALLSGVLLKTSIYAILRYSLITNRCLGPQFTSHLFIFFGLLSLIVSAGLILAQKDFKRLLAYSSIEHIGIIIFGFGIGGPLGIYGATFHIFNHAVTKALLFFSAGNLVRSYGTHSFSHIRGVIRALPFTGFMLLMGIFAIAGFPPFSIFFSEMMILTAAFMQGYQLFGALLLMLIVIVFSAIIYHFSQILFGEPPKNLKLKPESLIGKAAFIFLFIFIIATGWILPGFINQLILAIISIFEAT